MQETKNFPDLIKVVDLLHKNNVDLITVHLREDRRHIKDCDVEELRKKIYYHLT